ncbi:MAG: ABC transporter permease [Actinobacteria bacterium]|nr:ABC transporter permease [Actinomycetota bacterium]MBU1943962.1 ABC transporter permease [Actinomycetota bacterium]MBU2686950.1 ABC transporter permease [Actinomycetota bacterium]
MRSPRFLTVTSRVFKELRNDRRTLALIVIAPVFAMFVFGLAFSGEVHDVPLIVVNQDQGAAPVPGAAIVSISGKIIANLDTKTLSISTESDPAKARSDIEDGDAYGALVFPEGFTASVVSEPSGATTSIELLLDKSNINVATAITQAVNEALLETMDQAGEKPPVTVDMVAVFGQNAKFMDFFVPGIMAFTVYLITTLLTLITFVGERTSGTLQRMLATTLSERDIVMGYAVTFSLIGMGQALLLLIIAILVFDISVVGNVLLAFLVIALLAVVSQAMGILLSSTARREAQAIQVLPFVVLPAFLLSGIFWPIEAIPSWLRPLSYLVPPTYAVDASRAVMLKGWGVSEIWIDIVALLAMAAFFLTLAVFSLKTRKD